MGLYSFEIEKIKPLCKPMFRAISFGHPDILATPKQLKPIMGTILPTDNEEIVNSKFRTIYKGRNIVGSAKIVFEALGGLLHCVDKFPGYGIDELFDLNKSGVAIDQFDLVIDPGTSEHCWNVGQAIINMANCVKVGGHIYHMVPMAHWNHGFWNFSPCAFNDFYTQNGFKIIELLAEFRGKFMQVELKKDNGVKFMIPNNGRKLNLMCIAKRVEDREIGYPTQYKYYRPD
jgi:SAM-dependent methyltransferase